jgi:S1-C subfamily serine protease
MQLPDAIDSIRRSVVQIQAFREGVEPATVGTGFIVASAGDTVHVVTANHVVEAVDAAAGQSIHVAFAAPDVIESTFQMKAGFVGTSARVVDAVFKQDLALLEVTGPRTALLAEVESKTGSKTMYRRETYRDPARLSSAKLREGVALAVSGYPLAEPSLVTNAGILATTFSMAGGQEGYLGDFTVNPGNIGGPVYTVGNAEVVGVCAALKLAPLVGGEGAYGAGLTVIVPVDQVEAMLGWNGLVAGAASNEPAQTQQKRKRSGRRRRRG